MFKKLFAPTDMTVGTPWKSILAFTLPMLIGNIAQQLYNTVDTIVVGKYIGDNALSAVGSAGPIINMLLVLFIGISAGATIMVSQYFGARNREALSLTIGNCITITAISCVALIAIMLPFIRPILVALNTPPAILDDCTGYLQICLIGIAGLGYYNILSGIIRGLGDSVSALIYLLVATAINIVLDIVFVAYCDMGVPGVALATVIAQIVSSICCMVKLTKMQQHYDLTVKHLKPVGSYMKTIVKLGLPSGLTQAIFSSAMIIVQSLTNCFGEQFIAANVVVMRVDGFAMMPNFSFGTALTTYAGQNVGAGKLDRVHDGVKHGLKLALSFSVTITIILVLFGKILFGFFTDTPELIELAIKMMRVLAVGYICVSVTQILGGIMRGCGDTVTPMWISMIQTIVIRVPLAYLLAYLTKSAEYPHGAPIALFGSMLISWVLGMIMSIIAFRSGRWKRKLL